MAAAYGFHICQSHAFFDGNKRTARMAMLTFLSRNDYKCTASEFELYAVMLAIASKKMDKREFTEWLQTVVKRKKQLNLLRIESPLDQVFEETNRDRGEAGVCSQL